MSVVTEENIVEAILNKEEDALSYVLDKYGNLIKSIINKHLQLLKIYQEECFNDVLLAIWENIERYDKEKSTLKNWIAGISRYKAIDYSRKYIRESSWENVDAAYDLEDENARLTLLEIENNSMFEELIVNLNKEDKDLFRRLFLHEEDINKISNDMNLSASVLYNRISRGKKKIRTFLGGKDL